MARRNRRYPLYLLVLLLPAISLAEPEVNTRHVYYMINGGTAAEIWEDIKNKTPVEQDGRWHVGYTKWDVNWRFWWRNNSDGCEITRVSTTLDVVYTMPKLSSTRSLPDTLSDQWDRFYAALFEHERGHKSIGLRAAVAIEDTLKAMPPEPSCTQLEQAANRSARDLIAKYVRIEKDYDRTTNHGLKTGVVFPVVNASR